jgi:PA domain/Secretion system C-terminal sorting domain
MKKAFTLFLFVVAAVWQLGAQIPTESPIPVSVRIEATDGSARVLDYGKPGAWCDTLIQTVSGPIALAFGLDSLGNETDSLVCDSMAADLTGKIALISRGTCEFGWKALRAQEAGAIGVFLYNRAFIGEDSGGPIGMGAGAVGAQVNIPAIMLSKEDGLAILEKLDAGVTVTGFFEVRSFGGPRTAYSYQTPQEAIKPLSDVGVTFINIDNGAAIPSLTVSAEFTDPNGQVSTLSETLTDVQPLSVNTVVFADSYTPSAVGTYNVTFKNSVSPDEIEQSFLITDDHTFALDNDDLIPNTNGTAELDSAGFVNGGFNFHLGNVYRTGPEPVIATHVTFVLGNHTELYSGEPSSDVMYINIRNADPDGNGSIPNPAAFAGYSGLNENGGPVIPIASTEYVIQETDQDFQFTTIELPSPVTLAANKIYVVTVEYDGTNAGTGIPPKFAFGGETPPAAEVGSVVYYGDSLRINTVNFFRKNYFLRLHLDGFGTNTDNPLDDRKVSVSPVPASNSVNLELDLDHVAPEVEVRILDFTGRIVSTRILENVQNGRYGFNVSQMANGTYFMSINTPEGFRSKKFQVMH